MSHAEAVAVSGSKFKAVNNRDHNFSKDKFASRLAHLKAEVGRYIEEAERTSTVRKPTRSARNVPPV